MTFTFDTMLDIEYGETEKLKLHFSIFLCYEEYILHILYCTLINRGSYEITIVFPLVCPSVSLSVGLSVSQLEVFQGN